jgi:opacity protein-like surface antigen
MKSASLSLLCALAGLASIAHAEDNTFEITPYGGYQAGGAFETVTEITDADGTREVRTDRKLRNDSSYGVLLHLIQTTGAYYELSYSKFDTELRGADPFDVSVEHFQIGGTLDFAEPEAYVIPYIVLTVGASRFVPDRSDIDDKTAASFSLGFGFKIPLTQHIAIRTEARGYVSLLNGDSDIFCRSSPPDAVCDIRVKSDYFIQGQGLVGVTIGF